MPPPVAVVHLVRARNAPDTFETFMASYEHHPADAESRLVLLLKGFDDQAAACPFLDRAAAFAPQALHVPDAGFDITAYRSAARILDEDLVCFLNSFSVIKVPGWLGHLRRAFDDPDVGAAGATGSWGSHSSYNRFQAGLGGPYAEAFASRAEAREAMHALAGSRGRGRLAEHVNAGRLALRDARDMPSFPSAHLRTNAFLVERSLFASLNFGRRHDKRAAYRFESGRSGFTNQLRDRGLRVVVVAADGTSSPPCRWPETETFQQGDQANLLVADNQTQTYTRASLEQRRVLSAFAWGDRAAPRPPSPYA